MIMLDFILPMLAEIADEEGVDRREVFLCFVAQEVPYGF